MRSDEQLRTQLSKYERYFGDIHKFETLKVYRGTVSDINVQGRPDLARVILSNGKETLVRLLPKVRLALIKAVFPGAQIEYIIQACGTRRISDLKYIGPSREELLAAPIEKLSKADIAALDNGDLTYRM